MARLAVGFKKKKQFFNFFCAFFIFQFFLANLALQCLHRFLPGLPSDRIPGPFGLRMSHFWFQGRIGTLAGMNRSCFSGPGPHFTNLSHGFHPTAPQQSGNSRRWKFFCFLFCWLVCGCCGCRSFGSFQMCLGIGRLDVKCLEWRRQWWMEGATQSRYRGGSVASLYETLDGLSDLWWQPGRRLLEMLLGPRRASNSASRRRNGLTFVLSWSIGVNIRSKESQTKFIFDLLCSSDKLFPLRDLFYLSTCPCYHHPENPAQSRLIHYIGAMLIFSVSFQFQRMHRQSGLPAIRYSYYLNVQLNFKFETHIHDLLHRVCTNECYKEIYANSAGSAVGDRYLPEPWRGRLLYPDILTSAPIQTFN
ncbi:hypothetical protein VP01_1157g2 [Puccinia sorghi]|uniref:Uncharacterized protein n=1 Tax=Puccinia sorghi TaxID=27349 RepID=A0A0L6VRU4_9BASI|nr:hypothetical protein VP01_1157g2 [Puccinia sorghi]